jgi:hypothetical protein
LFKPKVSGELGAVTVHKLSEHLVADLAGVGSSHPSAKNSGPVACAICAGSLEVWSNKLEFLSVS